jgi:hypothetical protein
MKTRDLILAGALLTLGCAAYGQNTTGSTSAQNTRQTAPVKPRGRSAAGEYGSGVGDAGKGAAGGAGNAAKGAGQIVTLHPIAGGKSVGKGGKDVVEGAGKGTGKVVKGTGKIFTHPF